MTMQTKRSDRCKGLKNATRPMGLSIILLLMLLTIPSFVPLGSAQWKPGTIQTDQRQGEYNWTIKTFNASANQALMQNWNYKEPKYWEGELTELSFYCYFRMPLDPDSLRDGVTVNLAGGVNNTWSMRQIWTMASPVSGDFEIASDLDQLRDSGYNISNVLVRLVIRFDVEYLKLHNVTMITVRFDDMIKKWNGEPYYSTPFSMKLEIYPTRILTSSEMYKYPPPPTAESSEFDPILNVITWIGMVPLYLIIVMVAYIDYRNKKILKELTRSKAKGLKVGSNGIAETLLKLLDQSEIWMKKRRNFALILSACVIFFYFIISTAFLMSGVGYSNDKMLKIEGIVIYLTVLWIILIVHAYLYNRLRSDDLDWTIKIRTLKKREGDYLADLK